MLRYNDYGVNPDGGWEVFYKNIAIIDDKLVSAAVASNSVKTFTNSAVVTGLSASSTYRFTVFAIGALTSVNSPPSNYVEIVVP